MARKRSVPSHIAISDTLADCSVSLRTHAVQGPAIVMLMITPKATCIAEAVLVEEGRLDETLGALSLTYR